MAPPVLRSPLSRTSRPRGAPLLCDCFYLHWGNTLAPRSLSVGTLMAMDCTISYCTKGSVQNANLDRGRDLASLDNDLLAICCASANRQVRLQQRLAGPTWLHNLLDASPS